MPFYGADAPLRVTLRRGEQMLFAITPPLFFTPAAASPLLPPHYAAAEPPFRFLHVFLMFPA